MVPDFACHEPVESRVQWTLLAVEVRAVSPQLASNKRNAFSETLELVQHRCMYGNKKPLKSYDDFIKAMAVGEPGSKIPDGLSPEEHAEMVEEICNDLSVKHRYIFATWPRPDPFPNWRNADFETSEKKTLRIITPQNSCIGKMAPNGLEFWGETLLDFYYFHRMLGVHNVLTISTGSKLYQWCKENGEAEGTTWDGKEIPAKDCIMWAKDEREPELVEVYDIALPIKEREEKIREASPFESSTFPDQSNVDKCPPPSVFDPSAYPPAWNKLHPFSFEGPGAFHNTPALEHYIPQHLLPEKLVVHDPHNLLHALPQDGAGSSIQTEDFSLSADQTYLYRLKHSTKHSSRRTADEEEMQEDEAQKKAILENFLTNPHSSTKIKPPGIDLFEHGTFFGKISPPVYIVYPSRPPLAAASEAHLYLSRSNYIGQGNHSFIYHGEWEVPRSLLVPELLCMKCVMEDAIEIVKQEDGEDDELKDPRWQEAIGENRLTPHEKHSMPIILPMEGADDLAHGEYEFPRHPYGDPPPLCTYTGPYRVIQSRCQYQSLERGPYCKHFKDSIHPLTTKVRVAAKLSIEHDAHLANEANNHQAFLKHIFQHWSGFNIVAPILDPTPVGPLFPQYDGYYVPEQRQRRKAKQTVEDEDDAMDLDCALDSRKPYRSPLLLMEHWNAN